MPSRPIKKYHYDIQNGWVIKTISRTFRFETPPPICNRAAFLVLQNNRSVTKNNHVSFDNCPKIIKEISQLSTRVMKNYGVLILFTSPFEALSLGKMFPFRTVYKRRKIISLRRFIHKLMRYQRCVSRQRRTNHASSSIYCCTYISLDGDVLKMIAR